MYSHIPPRQIPELRVHVQDPAKWGQEALRAGGLTVWHLFHPPFSCPEQMICTFLFFFNDAYWLIWRIGAAACQRCTQILNTIIVVTTGCLAQEEEIHQWSNERSKKVGDGPGDNRRWMQICFNNCSLAWTQQNASGFAPEGKKIP